MAYARSKKSITRVEHVLKELLAATDDIAFQSPEPAKLAYAIHEAFQSAAIYPEYADYAALRDKYSIRIRANKVIAELKDKQLTGLMIVRAQLSKMTIKDVADALGVVGAATTHKASEMFFPDARFDASALASLYNWAEPTGYYIIDHGDNGLTLTKIHPGEMAWTPVTPKDDNESSVDNASN